MLQTIRDRTQGWIAGIIISLLILSFALWGIHSYIGGAVSSSSVAKVNGTEISKQQLSVAYERLRRQMQMQFSTNNALPEQAETGLKDRALQTLVNIEVLKQASIDQNYRISSLQTDSYIENVPEFQINGRFSLARFQQILSTTLFSTQDFVDLIHTSLLIDQPRLGLIFTSFAMPDEIVNTMSLIGQEREIQFANLPYQNFAKQPINIPAEKIQAYYKEHDSEFKTPEQVSIEYLEFSIKDLMSGNSVTEQAVKNFYAENVNSFTQPAQWKIESVIVPVSITATEADIANAQNNALQIEKKAKTEKNIYAIASSYSGTKAGENLQGWVTLDKLPTELQKTITNLKSGQVTTVRTVNAFLIVKIDQHKDAEVKSFDAVKDKVKESLLQQQAAEKFANLKEKIANITYEHPESLMQASKEMNLPIKATGLFTKDKGNKDISDNTKIRETAFSNDVLNLQNNSDVIQLTPDSVIVLRVKTHSPATLLPLSSVEKQITDKLKTAEIESKADQTAKEIQQKLQSGASVTDISKQYGLTWKSVGYIGRHATKIDQAILDAAFGMPKPQDGKKVYAATKITDGYAIIALSGVKAGNPNSSKEQYQVFGEQIQNAQGLLEYDLYKQSLINRAKIVMES
jgi:peptidyl-prolyl cis-trans isomerase D